MSITVKKGSKSNDEYGTPKSAFQAIEKYLPKDKLIYDPFYLDGKAGQYLREVGCLNVIHQAGDFFTNTHGYDMLVSNPAYSIKAKIFKKLILDNKPFMLLLPVSTITKQFIRPIIAKCSIIVPDKRIHFEKGGVESDRCPFDCVWICYQNEILGEGKIVYLEKIETD